MAENEFRQEFVLSGGNSTVVHRLGETVRRKIGAHSPAVHALLIHLAQAGFENSPRFSGIDDHGREVLSYLEGTVGNYPILAQIRGGEAMDTAVEILRRLHDLTEGLRLPQGYADHLRPGTTPEVICHWDAAPYNYVFEGSRAVGLIDFDEAGPGRRIDDLAYFAYRFAPLCSEDNFADGGWPSDIDRFGRLRRIFERYPDPRATQLPELVIDRLESMKREILVRLSAPERSAPARELEKHVEIYTRDQVFVSDHRAAIVTAVR